VRDAVGGRERAALVAVFAAALAVRLAYVLSIQHAVFFTHLQTEPLRYERWAAAILAGHAPAPPFDEPPGYAYFLAAVHRVLGRSATAVALVQVLLDAVTCTLVVVLGRRWFGARTGLVAGALAAAYGPLVYFTGAVEPATAFVCATALAIAAQTAGWWIASGMLWDLALLFRAEIVVAFPLALLDAARRGGRAAAARTAAPIVVLALLLAAVNWAHAGKLVPYITSGGLNFWAGNDPWADGVNPFFSGPRAAIMGEVAGRAHDASEADRLFLARALAFWRAQPGTAVALTAKKILWTLGDRELPNTGDIEWQEAQSALFRAWFLPLRFGLVLPVALVGAVALGRRWRELPLLAAPIVVALVTAAVFFTNARLRLVMIPSVLLLAAVGAVHLVARRGRPRDGVALAAGIVLAWGGFFGVRTYRIPEITVNTGILERHAGHPAAAAARLRDGVAAAPDDALGWTHLALALEEAGDPRGALDAWLDGLARRGDDAVLRAQAFAFCGRHGIDPAALDRWLAAPAADRPAGTDALRAALR